MFSFSFTTEQQCIKAIISLNPNKPLGPTSIPGWALRDSYQIVATHLCFIFNEFVKEESFPISGKLAEVCPVFKKGDPHVPENYRPISITGSIAKVFENYYSSRLTATFMLTNCSHQFNVATKVIAHKMPCCTQHKIGESA